MIAGVSLAGALRLGGIVVLACAPAVACRAQETGTWRPSPTIAEDLGKTTVRLVDGYAKAHPRLLFSAQDRDRLNRKASDHSKLWGEVEASAGRCVGWIPTPQEARSGARYWRIERVESAALSWLV